MRPPLSPIVEAELRAACAYIHHNFKPSHVVYNDQHGGAKPKQQLDYAAIKDAAPSNPQPPTAPAPRPISKISGRSSEKPQSEPEVQDADSTGVEKSRWRLDVPLGGLSRSNSSARASAQKRALQRAEQMAGDAEKGPPPTTRARSNSHLRSVSSPLNSIPAAQKAEFSERPPAAPRTHSAETTGSTPQTDSTDYPWSDERSSTGMTSAAITPARGSKRTSSQALQSGSESGSLPKGEHVEPGWMRQELEKHKKAQQKRRQEKAQEEAKTSSDETDVTPKHTIQAPTPVVKVPERKPVPIERSTSRTGTEIPRSVSRQSSATSGEMLRSPSVRAREAPRSVSGQAGLPSRSASQRLAPEPPPSRARSFKRTVKNYIRPSASQRSQKQSEPEEPSRPSSRAGSVTNHVREYFKPGSTAGSRRPSIDQGRSGGRGRSIDSFRSAMSDMASSATAEAGKVKQWKPFHRRGRSHTTGEEDQPGSSNEPRGRSATRNGSQTQQQSSKPPIDLNRELPPLPSLDAWKEENPMSPVKSPKSHRSALSRQEGKRLTLEPDIGERDEIVMARMGSPTPPRSHTHSHQASAEAQQIPPPPSAPPPPPPNHGSASVMSANMSSPSDFHFNPDHLTPKSSTRPVSGIRQPSGGVRPRSVLSDPKKERRRSKSIQTGYPPDLHDRVRNAMLGSPTSDQPPVTGKRVPGVAPPGGLRRNVSKGGYAVATTSSTPLGHSRNNSGHVNLSRKLSMDESANRYQNLHDLSGSKRAQPVQQSSKDKKWWQRVARRPNHPTWMDHVVHPGTRGGMLLKDETAGAPVIRY